MPQLLQVDNDDPAISMMEEMHRLGQVVCRGEKDGWLAFHPGEELNNFNLAQKSMDELNSRWDLLRVDLQHRASKGTL
jgi:hypothetical protein